MRIEPGFLVEFSERPGEPAHIAIVQRIWPDESLQLFVMHFQAATNVRAALKEQCRVLMGPSQYETVEMRIKRLEDTVNFLMAHANVEATPEPEEEDTPEKGVQSRHKRPWPKGTKHAIADPVPD